MIELRDPKQREQYIRDYGSRRRGAICDVATIEFLDRGCLNYVYSAVIGEQVLYFKQALSVAKHSGRLGPELAQLSSARTSFEAKSLAILQSLLPSEFVVPEVLNYDVENNILVLTDVGGSGSLTVDAAIEQGSLRLASAAQLGRCLGIMHRKSTDREFVIRGTREADSRHWATFLKLRTASLASQSNDERIRGKLRALYQQAMTECTSDVLLFIDFSPKNLIQRADSRLGVLDSELACGIGDPAYDLGFLLGDVLCHASKSKISAWEIEEIVCAMLHAYQVQNASISHPRFLQRLGDYVAAVFLYRACGGSPDPTLGEAQRYILKKTAERLLGSESTISAIPELVRHVTVLNSIQLRDGESRRRPGVPNSRVGRLFVG